jgi:hypothetical protein
VAPWAACLAVRGRAPTPGALRWKPLPPRRVARRVWSTQSEQPDDQYRSGRQPTSVREDQALQTDNSQRGRITPKGSNTSSVTKTRRQTWITGPIATGASPSSGPTTGGGEVIVWPGAMCATRGQRGVGRAYARHAWAQHDAEQEHQQYPSSRAGSGRRSRQTSGSYTATKGVPCSTQRPMPSIGAAPAS